MEQKASDVNNAPGASKEVRVRPVIVAGKIYACGAAGFRAASAGITGVTGTVFQPDGYYVRMPSGVRLHDKDGEPFVFVKREGNSGFIVTCHETAEGIRYMFGASSGDLAKLGLDTSAPETHRRELAERLLWETSPESGQTVYELHQRMVATESEYEKVLVRVYGSKRAEESRYWKHTDVTLVAAHKAFVAASSAWCNAMRFSQTPTAVREALAATGESSGTVPPPVYLVARWDSTETASFATNGPREEMSAILGRLSDDLDARSPGPAMYAPIPLLDTNGNAVGMATFEVAIPGTPTDGKPLLLIPVGDFTRMAITVTDVHTKLQSCVEDVLLTSVTEPSRLARLHWSDLPSLERRWYGANVATPESLQASHDRVRGMLVAQDRTNPDARFLPAYEGIERAAESLGLQPFLQGFGDSARVGYFKDGDWTGIASEIALNGKVLTTLDGQRTEGTGYTAEGEWQRDQMECALNRLRHAADARPTRDVYAEAADLYEHGSP